MNPNSGLQQELNLLIIHLEQSVTLTTKLVDYNNLIQHNMQDTFIFERRVCKQYEPVEMTILNGDNPYTSQGLLIHDDTYPVFLHDNPDYMGYRPLCDTFRFKHSWAVDNPERNYDPSSVIFLNEAPYNPGREKSIYLKRRAGGITQLTSIETMHAKDMLADIESKSENIASDAWNSILNKEQHES